jgi:Transposase DDE domain
LFACLVLKSFLRTDYRGVVAHLQDCPSLTEAIGLRHLPHFTTLQKASRRLLSAPTAKRLLSAAVRNHLGRKRTVSMAALDSTGLETSAASAYFIKRRVRTGEPWKTVVYHRYAKLGVVCNTQDHFILSLHVCRGPRPDVDEFQLLVTDALARVRIAVILGDAGFDSESNHVFARDEHGIRTIIPAKHGRPTKKPASGRYRRLMQRRFDHRRYGQRAQIETVISMIKRRQGAHVRGRTYTSQCRDLRLMALTHNVMILWHIRLFYRAVLTPLSA